MRTILTSIAVLLFTLVCTLNIEAQVFPSTLDEINCTWARKKYTEKYPDVKGDPWVHYNTIGKKEGKKWSGCAEGVPVGVNEWNIFPNTNKIFTVMDGSYSNTLYSLQDLRGSYVLLTFYDKKSTFFQSTEKDALSEIHAMYSNYFYGQKQTAVFRDSAILKTVIVDKTDYFLSEKPYHNNGVGSNYKIYTKKSEPLWSREVEDKFISKDYTNGNDIRSLNTYIVLIDPYGVILGIWSPFNLPIFDLFTPSTLITIPSPLPPLEIQTRAMEGNISTTALFTDSSSDCLIPSMSR